MRWGQIRSWSVRHCPAENPSRSQEVFPPLVWKGGKARRKEGSCWQTRPPSQTKWRHPRPGSWAGVPLTPGQGGDVPLTPML